MASIDLSVAVPIYNEEGNLPRLYERLDDALSAMGINYEIIFVNDGSQDQSFSIIQDLAEEDEHVKYIDFSRNFGHQTAIFAGMDQSRGEAVVVMDGDLQDPPELIPELYGKFREGYQVVYAQRRKRQGESFFKRYTAKWFYRLLQRLTSFHIPLDTGDFRLVHQKVVETVRQMPERDKFLRGQIAWVGFHQTHVLFDRAERHAGETKYTFWKMVRLAMDAITSFSDFPLRFATFTGFFFSFVAFFMMGWALYAKFLTDQVVKGWTSIMISVLFIGGIQLIVLGIMGEYMSRISSNVRRRPVYVIHRTNIPQEKQDE
jgi:dolichol-phosphate mannosyltransferase